MTKSTLGLFNSQVHLFSSPFLKSGLYTIYKKNQQKQLSSKFVMLLEHSDIFQNSVQKHH